MPQLITCFLFSNSCLPLNNFGTWYAISRNSYNINHSVHTQQDESNLTTPCHELTNWTLGSGFLTSKYDPQSQEVYTPTFLRLSLSDLYKKLNGVSNVFLAFKTCTRRYYAGTYRFMIANKMQRHMSHFQMQELRLNLERGICLKVLKQKGCLPKVSKSIMRIKQVQ